MNIKHALGWLSGGIALGLLLALNLGADPAKPAPDWSRLQVVTYQSGLTGFFDPASGKLYLYDTNLEKCRMIRQLTALGEPLKRLQD